MINKKYDSLDVMKFILSIFVLSLHIKPISMNGGYEYVRAVLRLSVPLFFITSGFLFFNHISNLSSNSKREYIVKYTLRILKLYFVWFIVLLPITIFVRQWNKFEFPYIVIEVLREIFLSSTFIASWYLMALIIGTIIVFYLSKVVNNHVLFIISFFIYVLCCVCSSWRNILINYDLKKISYIINVFPIYNSFPVALLWITIGKVISENDRLLYFISKYNKISLFISLILYLVEYYIVIHFKLAICTDSLFMMVPFCIIIFITIINSNLVCTKSKVLRKMSTIIVNGK